MKNMQIKSMQHQMKNPQIGKNWLYCYFQEAKIQMESKT